MNEFYEINRFNREVLSSVFDILHCFLGHLQANKMEVIYFDWPLTCLIWNLLDYFNFYGSIQTTEIQKFNEFNQVLFKELIQVILEKSQQSIRFKRLVNFLDIVMINSESSVFNNKNLRYKSNWWL